MLHVRTWDPDTQGKGRCHYIRRNLALTNHEITPLLVGNLLPEALVSAVADICSSTQPLICIIGKEVAKSQYSAFLKFAQPEKR